MCGVPGGDCGSAAQVVRRAMRTPDANPATWRVCCLLSYCAVSLLIHVVGVSSCVCICSLCPARRTPYTVSFSCFPLTGLGSSVFSVWLLCAVGPVRPFRWSSIVLSAHPNKASARPERTVGRGRRVTTPPCSPVKATTIGATSCICTERPHKRHAGLPKM